MFFSEGESTYNLEDAQALRIKIAKLGESIDLISKRISVLGTRCVENPPQDQELRLHHMVRVSAVIFLKEELLTVQVLPSKEKYAELQKERQKRLEARIAYERQLEEEQFETILDTLLILHLISQKPLLLLDHETKLYPESILLSPTT